MTADKTDAPVQRQENLKVRTRRRITELKNCLEGNTKIGIFDYRTVIDTLEINELIFKTLWKKND